MKRFNSIALLTILMILFSACRAASHEVIIVAGSTSVQPYAEILAEEFKERHRDGEVDIQGGGSSAGITAVESGIADIGMSSRALKEAESHLWQREIAKDGLALIVHPSNPINDISLAQIRGIYTGQIKSWDEINGPSAKIHIITREDGSGTRAAFEELVMGNENISPKAIVQDSNGAVRMLVADDPHSIGFLSLGLVDDTVKALTLDGAAATGENVTNGSYSLFRPFIFVAKAEPEGEARRFIDFTLSNEGQRLLANEGLIP